MPTQEKAAIELPKDEALDGPYATKITGFGDKGARLVPNDLFRPPERMVERLLPDLDGALVGARARTGRTW